MNEMIRELFWDLLGGRNGGWSHGGSDWNVNVSAGELSNRTIRLGAQFGGLRQLISFIFFSFLFFSKNSRPGIEGIRGVTSDGMRCISACMIAPAMYCSINSFGPFSARTSKPILPGPTQIFIMSSLPVIKV